MRELEILLEDPDLQAAYGLDLDDATRTFNSFSEARIENGPSRVYLGIHFDFDDLDAQEVGIEVAEAAESFFVVPEGRNKDGKKAQFVRNVLLGLWRIIERDADDK